MRWCETFASVDSDQGVLLYRNVELEETWELHAELGAPEHPRRDALTRPLPDVHLPGIDRVVLLMEDARPSWKTEAIRHTVIVSLHRAAHAITLKPSHTHI